LIATTSTAAAGSILERRLAARRYHVYRTAPDEKTAIAEAAKQFNITPARRKKIAVTRLADRKRDHKEGPGRRLGWRPRPPTQVHPRWRAGIARYSSRLFLLHFGG